MIPGAKRGPAKGLGSIQSLANASSAKLGGRGAPGFERARLGARAAAQSRLLESMSPNPGSLAESARALGRAVGASEISLAVASESLGRLFENARDRGIGRDVAEIVILGGFFAGIGGGASFERAE